MWLRDNTRLLKQRGGEALKMHSHRVLSQNENSSSSFLSPDIPSMVVFKHLKKLLKTINHEELITSFWLVFYPNLKMDIIHNYPFPGSM